MTLNAGSESCGLLCEAIFWDHWNPGGMVIGQDQCCPIITRKLEDYDLYCEANRCLVTSACLRISTRALIFATRQSYSSLKRPVALKAQIQKHVRTPNAIGATTGGTKFQTLAPAPAYRLPPDYIVLPRFPKALVLLLKTQASQHARALAMNHQRPRSNQSTYIRILCRSCPPSLRGFLRHSDVIYNLASATIMAVL